MNKNFDKHAFNVRFDAAILELQAAEKVTKKILGDLSRVVLEQIHFDGDIQPLNRLTLVLTPVNKRTCVLFFQHFSGFSFNEKEEKFSKKDKSHYAEKLAASEEFLSNEDNNIWTWASEHVQIEAKPFDLKRVTSYVSNALKKAEEQGVSQVEFMRAIFAAGIEVESVTAIINEMVEKEEKKDLNFVEKLAA
ncbi:MAG TPA: hypothetical protein VFM18_21765 [Methanosarcina sp.]|nr:hypothetical protein [Methanosarcina sp.]